MKKRRRSLTIETPEGVIFSYRLATPVSRSLAWAVDASIIAAASSIASKTCGVLGAVSADFANALGVAFYLLISIGYGIVLEWRWRGQTLGKRLLGLRVIDAQGLRLQFPRIALRNLLRFVDMLPLLYLVGGVTALLSRNGQRLGDFAAGTVVAHERLSDVPDLERIAPARHNSLAAWPHLAARLRSLASPEAVRIAIEALARRDEYTASARLELFRELSSYFRSLVRFPASAVEGLTDEQYVRSALRVIYTRNVVHHS